MTGGAGFIGSHVADALLADGYEVRVIDDLSSGVAERVPSGAELVELDIVEQRALREAFDALRAAGRLPPGRAGQRRRLGRRPRSRRRRQRPRHAQRARGRRRARRAGRLHLDRRRAVRRRGAAADARGPDPGAAVALRRLEVGRRGLRADVVAAVGDPAHGRPARQRLRAAPEPARRGGRGGDLHRPHQRAQAPEALRPRQADPRLHLRRRRRQRAADGDGQGRRLQRRDRNRNGRDDDLAKPLRDRRRRARARARGPAARASCSTAAWTSPAPGPSSAGARRSPSRRGSRSPTGRCPRNSPAPEGAAASDRSALRAPPRSAEAIA